ncbi:MAG: tetratricopeptide repeat protein [Nevskia sp.]|nr:tetratricopeptide repeat protein [Nevskia sp.]
MIAMAYCASTTRTRAACGVALLTAALLAGCADEPARPYKPVRQTPNDAGAVQSAAAAVSKSAVDDAQPRFAAVLTLLDQHQPDQAEPALVALAHDYPQLSGPATELGLLYLRSNRRPQALQSFEQALRANSQNTVALNCLGILYRQRGDFARAEQSYLRAIALKPNDAKAHLNLGILYELSLHRPRDALDQYRESQKYVEQENLMVTAWIKELEPQANPVASSVASAAIRAAR